MWQYKINNQIEVSFRGNFYVLNYVAMPNLLFDGLEAYWIFLFRTVLFVHI